MKFNEIGKLNKDILWAVARSSGLLRMHMITNL